MEEAQESLSDLRWILSGLTVVFLLLSLPMSTQLTFMKWTAAGLVIYFLYGYRKSPLAGRK